MEVGVENGENLWNEKWVGRGVDWTHKGTPEPWNNTSLFTPPQGKGKLTTMSIMVGSTIRAAMQQLKQYLAGGVWRMWKTAKWFVLFQNIAQIFPPSRHFVSYKICWYYCFSYRRLLPQIGPQGPPLDILFEMTECEASLTYQVSDKGSTLWYDIERLYNPSARNLNPSKWNQMYCFMVGFARLGTEASDMATTGYFT